jgi:sortase A
MKKWLQRLGVGLIFLIALVMIFHNQLAALLLRTYRPEVTKKSVAVGKREAGDYDWKHVKTITAKDIAAARLQSSKMHYIGLLAIPKIGVSLPISNGVADNNLTLGAGTLYANQQMGEGNYNLASHFVPGTGNEDVLFSPLYYKGKVGQKIYLTDMSKVYTYTATSVKVVAPTAVEVTDNVPGQKLVTLITCNYTAEAGRVVMQGTLEKVTDWQNTSKTVTAAFKTSNEWIK